MIIDAGLNVHGNSGCRTQCGGSGCRTECGGSGCRTECKIKCEVVVGEGLNYIVLDAGLNVVMDAGLNVLLECSTHYCSGCRTECGTSKNNYKNLTCRVPKQNDL